MGCGSLLAGLQSGRAETSFWRRSLYDNSHIMSEMWGLTAGRSVWRSTNPLSLRGLRRETNDEINTAPSLFFRLSLSCSLSVSVCLSLSFSRNISLSFSVSFSLSISPSFSLWQEQSSFRQTDFQSQARSQKFKLWRYVEKQKAYFKSFIWNESEWHPRLAGAGELILMLRLTFSHSSLTLSFIT